MPSKSSPRIDEHELGEMAEGSFDFCREVGAMATPCRKDKVGWDFYVVLPHLAGGSLLDASPRLNCSVQVKAQWITTPQGPVS